MELGLMTFTEMMHSPALHTWVKANRFKHYVPEELLTGFGLTVYEEDDQLLDIYGDGGNLLSE
jgi:hypothetical protein